MKAIVTALLLALAGTSFAAADDALLSRLVGEWTGRGTMKLRPDAAPERVFCKIANTLSGNALQQRGRCSLASNSGPIDGEITAEGSGRYAGSLASLASKGPATLTGTGTANRLDMNAKFIDAITREPATSTTTIELLSNGYRLSTVRADPKTGANYKSSEIVFSAK